MSNVFQLFGKEETENPSPPITGATIAFAIVTAMNAQLERAIQELSNHFDAIDQVIDSLGDPEARKLQGQCREALTIAALKLSQAIRTLPSLKITAIPIQETCGCRP
jgi:exonuclease VII small subunit